MRRPGRGAANSRQAEPAARGLDGRGSLRNQRHSQAARHALHRGRQRRRPGIGEFGSHPGLLADIQGLVAQAVAFVQQQQGQLGQRRGGDPTLAR